MDSIGKTDAPQCGLVIDAITYIMHAKTHGPFKETMG